MITTAPLLVADGVTKRFRRGPETVVAVHDASLELHPGSLTVLSGPSGSGKTTLLNLLLGWEQPDEGEVRGIPARREWAELAVLPQRLGLLEHLTLAENVALPTRVSAAPDDGTELMGALGIGHLADRFPAETSLGEQQRAAFARALVCRSRLIVADEPTSHQDDASARRVIDHLVAAAANGSTVVVATHDQRVASVGTQLLRIDDGVVTREA